MEFSEKEKIIDNKMQNICKYIDNELPDNCGFILLSYEFNREGRLIYASNTNRDDAANIMKEWLDKVNKENYGKDI